MDKRYLLATARYIEMNPMAVNLVRPPAITLGAMLMPILPARTTGWPGCPHCFTPKGPPFRMPIPIYRTGDRIGTPFSDMHPDRVACILSSEEEDSCAVFSAPGESAQRIATHILEYIRNETLKGRLPAGLPWQAGVSAVANAVLAGFVDDDWFSTIDIYSEVLLDAVFELIDLGKVHAPPPARF
ncbi:MAG: hypothetical protein RBT36_02010 [Desulfobulbus sp.]|jgi:acetyl-CoA hydrolase/succinyl-CoA:acetate CoA-transferase|nr:hypothetical protein [Desulfobulbus sp.]